VVPLRAVRIGHRQESSHLHSDFNSERDILGVPSSTVTQTMGGGRELVAVELHLYEDDLVSPRRLLLCTDGLTNFVTGEQIADGLRGHDGVEAVKVLIALALAAGGPDKVTVVLLEIGRVRPHEGEG